MGMTFFGNIHDILPLLEVFSRRIFNDFTDDRTMRVLAWNLLLSEQVLFIYPRR